jgi:hypothetical protein
LRLYQPHGSSKFRLYVGLLVNPNVYRKPSKEGEADDDDDGPTDIQTNTKDTSGSVLPVRSAYSVELDDHDDDKGTMQAPKSDPSSLLVQAAPRFDQVSLNYITFLTFLTYVCTKCLVPQKQFA